NYYEWRGSNSGSYGNGQAYQNTTSQSWDARFETYFINGLIKINTTTKNAPVVLGAYSLTDPWRISLNGTTAYVADGSSGMKLFDVSGNTPTLTGTYNSPTNAYDVITSGTYAYVSDGTGGLRIVDISNPASPSLTATYNTPGTAYATRLYGTTAYVADGSSVQVIDVSTPATPSLITSYTTPWNYRDIEINYPWAYLAVDSSLEGIFSLHLVNGPKINQLKVAAATFVDFNGWDAANDQIGMVSYASSASSPIDQTLTKTYSLVKSDINALVASGGTATGDGINAATTELNGGNHNPSALKFQILMSDGLTNSGSNSSTAAITADNNGIVIYTIGFGLDADATELTTIANITGGKYYAALDQNALVEVYALIAQQIQLIATDANISVSIPTGTLIISDGNGILQGQNLIFDINTQEPQPWVSTYTFNIPCDSQLACSSTLISIPSPGTEFQYVDANGLPQTFDWNEFSTTSFNYRDLNIELTSGNILGTNNVDLTFLVNSSGNLDTNGTMVEFYVGDPSLGNVLGSASVPPLCGGLIPGCVDHAYSSIQNVKAEGDLYAVVNPSGDIPECSFNDQDVIFCYNTPATQFYTLDYWAWLHG
ncbi:MAG: VWA domain-containing protein, partial [archaeon]